MAWRVCKIPGCPRKKPIQPFGTATRHEWLCPKHRAEAQQETVNRIARLVGARQTLARMMNGRESSD